MRLALFEDEQQAIDRVQRTLAEQAGIDAPKLDLKLSARIEFEDDFQARLQQIRDEKGPLAIIADMGLKLGGIESTLRAQIETDFDVMVPDSIPDSQLGGVTLCLEAIKNTQIQPLVIDVATSLGRNDDIVDFLRATAQSYGRDKTCIDSDLHALSSRIDYAPDIVDFVVRKFRICSTESIDTLASETLRAQFGKRDETGRRQLEMPEIGHPLRPSHVPDKILLSEQLKADLESYKTLYYIAGSDLAVEINKKGGIHQAYNDFDRRLMSVPLFAELLRRFNISLSHDLGDDAKIQLPIAPGALFVICLVDFLENAKINEVFLSSGVWQGRDGVELRIQLNNPIRFESAIMTGHDSSNIGEGGTSVAAFRRLLACKKDRFKELIAGEASEAEKNRIGDWPPQPLPMGEGNSQVYWAILKWRVEGSTLIIWWPSATGGREPW